MKKTCVLLIMGVGVWLMQREDGLAHRLECLCIVEVHLKDKRSKITENLHLIPWPECDRNCGKGC